MMTRRSLLACLAAAVADPERLIWTPGKKLIFIPKPRGWAYPYLKRGDRITIDGYPFYFMEAWIEN